MCRVELPGRSGQLSKGGDKGDKGVLLWVFRDIGKAYGLKGFGETLKLGV